MTVITVPDLSFSAFYYPDILRELLQAFRLVVDELGLTDEHEREVHVQLLRAFSLVGHLNNCRLDVTARELTLDTARLLESLKRMMRLVGVELSSASPAVSDILLKLSEATTSDIVGFVPELSEFATESVPPISFETLAEDGINLSRADEVEHVYVLKKNTEGTDGSVSAASPTVFFKGSGDPIFPTGAVGMHLFLASALNGGEFRVVERATAGDNVTLVRVPDSKSPAFQDEGNGIVWVLREFGADYATEANTGASTFDPWQDTTPGDTEPEVGDALYIAHDQIMTTQVNVVIDTAAADLTGVWEYFDSEFSKFNPSAVTDAGSGTIEFNLTTLLGTLDRNGVEVIVEYLPTGATERVVSVFSGGVNKVTTTGALGQTTISEDIEDYHVTADWVPFPNQDDGPAELTITGAAAWDIPQDAERSWLSTDVNLIEGVWIRWRVISSTGSPSTAPIIDTIDINQGDLYISFLVTQGETVGPQILGSSNGVIDQEFELPDTPYIDDSETIEVDETGGGTWTEYTLVQNFNTSEENSRHYMRKTSALDVMTAIFGNGLRGKIPPAGTDNVRGTYRIGGDIDGNVGLSQLVSNADGVSGVSEVTNPRSAGGWRMKDGGTAADIERVKRDAPATFRTRETASNPGDAATLATKTYKDDSGVKIVARAVAVDEALGPKTAKLLVVGADGTTLTSPQKTALQNWFNGDRHARPPVYGKLMWNYEITVFNFEPEVITVQATVTWPGGNQELIRNALLALIRPLALEVDGVTYVWDYDGYVSRSRIHSTIHAVDPNISDVPVLTLNGSPASHKLGKNGLPVTTAVSVQVSVQS